MSRDISEVIVEIVQRQRDAGRDDEFYLAGGLDGWLAKVGNHIRHVALGESMDSDFTGTGDTPEEAVLDLERNQLANDPIDRAAGES